VVFLAPRPKQRRIRSVLVRLRSLARGPIPGPIPWPRLPGEPRAADAGPARPRRRAGRAGSASEALYAVSATGAASPPRRARAAELGLRSRAAPGRRILELSGALDASTREPLVEALEDALEGDVEQIVLDLSDLDSIDPTGLDTVLTAHHHASDELKVLLIVPGPEPVQRVLEAARGPFLYACRQRTASARPRSRGRRSGRSGRPALPAPPHSARRS
jgi:anti-anti-sigma factor